MPSVVCSSDSVTPFESVDIDSVVLTSDSVVLTSDSASVMASVGLVSVVCGSDSVGSMAKVGLSVTTSPMVRRISSSSGFVELLSGIEGVLVVSGKADLVVSGKADLVVSGKADFVVYCLLVSD